MPESRCPPFLRLLATHWRLKICLGLALNCVFWSGYGLLAHHAFFPLCTMPLTWLDRMVTYQPEPWGWVYLSQFAVSGILPWLLSKKEALLRYSAGAAFMGAISFTVFLFCPVAGPRPAGADLSQSLKLITSYDGTFNCFPSLHAAFMFYLGALAWRMFGRARPRVVVGVALTWGGAILVSTLATKQHYALDLLAGGLLGLAADWLAWRGADITVAMTSLKSESRSHEGDK